MLFFFTFISLLKQDVALPWGILVTVTSDSFLKEIGALLKRKINVSFAIDANSKQIRVHHLNMQKCLVST